MAAKLNLKHYWFKVECLRFKIQVAKLNLKLKTLNY